MVKLLTSARPTAVADLGQAEAELRSRTRSLRELYDRESRLLQTAQSLDQLLPACQAYFAGRYQTAVADLNRLDPKGNEVRSTWLLLRAAARHALYFAQGQRDQRLLAAARQDVTDSRALGRNRRPAASLFSPRFIDFWRAAAR